MSLEVRKVIIKATVIEDQKGAGGGAVTPEDKETIIAECIEQVMEILKEKEER